MLWWILMKLLKSYLLEVYITKNSVYNQTSAIHTSAAEGHRSKSFSGCRSADKYVWLYAPAKTGIQNLKFCRENIVWGGDWTAILLCGTYKNLLNWTLFYILCVKKVWCCQLFVESKKFKKVSVSWDRQYWANSWEEKTVSKCTNLICSFSWKQPFRLKHYLLKNI